MLYKKSATSATSDVIGNKWPLNTLCIVIAKNQNTHLVILSHVSKYRLRPWFFRPEAKEREKTPLDEYSNQETI